MPYFIKKTSKGWNTIKDDGTVMGKHKSKKQAIAQMVAISLSEKIAVGGEMKRAETYNPPAGVANAAKRALKWIQEGKAGQGFTNVGRSRAAQLASGGVVSATTVNRMKSYFARHEVDKKATGFSSGEEGFPSPGRVAWDAWGGDPGQSWVNSLNLDSASRDAKDVGSVDSDGWRDESMTTSTRADVADVQVGDWVQWEPTLGEECEYGVIEEIQGLNAVIRLYEEEGDTWMELDETAFVLIADLMKIDIPMAVSHAEVDKPETSRRSKWLGVAWNLKARIEGMPAEARSNGKFEIRTNSTSFEIREDNKGMTISGYAAVFNSDSHPLPFTERVAPGAFKRSLQSRNEIKLLWNHDTGEPLASLRGGSLRLWEDKKGLAYEAVMANTTRGRDVAELIRVGVIDAMSFGFNVIKDSWDEAGNRILESVRLHEISVVSYPAYPDTAGTVSVRSEGIDAEALADALLKLESGEELEADHAELIKSVVSQLQKTPEVQEVQGNILDLKQKQLELLMKRV